MDANDKICPSGFGQARFVRADAVLSYQVRLDNMPKATAPAQKIVITDTP